MKSEHDWRNQGVRVIKSGCLDSNTLQTPGMLRAAAVNLAERFEEVYWIDPIHAATR